MRLIFVHKDIGGDSLIFLETDSETSIVYEGTGTHGNDLLKFYCAVIPI